MMERACGIRAKYALEGCRCFQCRVANTNYEFERARRKREGTWQPFASRYEIRKAMAHLVGMLAAGIGLRTIAMAAGVRRQRLHELLRPELRLQRARPATRRVKRATIQRILAVDVGRLTTMAGENAIIPAAETWRMVDALKEAGFSKAKIARLLGYRTRALQLSKVRIIGRNARKVKRLYDRWRYWSEVKWS